MRIFVTGGTGFTGSHVVSLFLKNGYLVRCLYRSTSDRSVLPQPEIEWMPGDVSNAEALSASMHGTDILINLVSLGFGHADSIIRAAKSARIQRAIFISTTAIFTELNAKSKSIRIAAEHAIEISGLQYTILRPTMIYGSRRDRNMWRLIRFMHYSSIIPVLGDGAHVYLQQPIYVEDVASAVLGCLKSEVTIGKCYNIAGKYPLTYMEVVDTIAKQMNKRVWKLHIASKSVLSILNFFEQVRIPFPIKAEQILRLNENKNFSYEEAQMDFGFNPLSFSDGISLELGSK